MRSEREEGRRDGLHEAAMLMDEMWEEQVKNRPRDNYLYAGLHSAFRGAALRLRQLADPQETGPKL